MLRLTKMIKGRLGEAELNLIKSVIGEQIYDKKINLQKIKSFWIPSDFKRFRIANFSLPLKFIGIPENPLSTAYNKSILVHEIFHQMQYRKSLISFFKLIIEQIIRRLFRKNTYEYGREKFLGGSLDIKVFEDIKTLEGQASFAQDFAYNYFLYVDMMNVHESLDTGRDEKMRLYRSRAEKYARVLKNSGLDSEAIREMA